MPNLTSQERIVYFLLCVPLSERSDPRDLALFLEKEDIDRFYTVKIEPKRPAPRTPEAAFFERYPFLFAPSVPYAGELVQTAVTRTGCDIDDALSEILRGVEGRVDVSPLELLFYGDLYAQRQEQLLVPPMQPAFAENPTGSRLTFPDKLLIYTLARLRREKLAGYSLFRWRNRR